jgi:hypothetical protein
VVHDVGLQNYKQAADQAADSNKPIRAELEEPPGSEHPLFKRALDAWAALITMRPGGGFGPTCIPWDKMMYYAETRYRLSSDQAAFFCDILLKADQIYVGHLVKKMQDEAKNPPPDDNAPPVHHRKAK